MKLRKPRKHSNDSLCAERDTNNQPVEYKAEVSQLHQPAASITTQLFIRHNE